MKIATVSMKSTSPYSQGKHYEVEKLNGESHADYEVRTWRNRMHRTSTGNVMMPPMGFANCLKESAKRLGIKVPGQRNKTYTKAFLSGLLVIDPLTLPDLVDEVPFDRLFVPSDGIPGSGKRVIKYFGRIDKWEGDVVFYISDDSITQEVFTQVAHNAGMLIGLGRFRPERGGYYGRFEVGNVKWEDHR